jgi:bifunctional ADP-heptose synthase (sugar kinase/adenylyltransferase)
MKILVIGDSCKDIFIYGQVSRMCPEAPVPVFNPTKQIDNLGMAANVVMNLYSCGVDWVDLVSNKEVITKSRYVEEKSNHMIMRVDCNDSLTEKLTEEKVKNIDFKKYDAVIVSDYCKGFLDTEVMRVISQQHDLVFLDTKKELSTWALGFNYIKVNEPEWNKSLSAGAKKEDWKDRLIITKGSKGCEYKGETYPVDKVNFLDVSGAGDTFLAGLVFSYLQTKDIILSIKYANEVATMVVQERGVTTPYGIVKQIEWVG